MRLSAIQALKAMAPNRCLTNENPLGVLAPWPMSLASLMDLGSVARPTPRDYRATSEHLFP